MITPQLAADALKPCPFCGRAAALTRWDSINLFAVECIWPDCPVAVATGEFPTVEEAVNAWNIRAVA